MQNLKKVRDTSWFYVSQKHISSTFRCFFYWFPISALSGYQPTSQADLCHSCRGRIFVSCKYYIFLVSWVLLSFSSKFKLCYGRTKVSSLASWIYLICLWELEQYFRCILNEEWFFFVPITMYGKQRLSTMRDCIYSWTMASLCMKTDHWLDLPGSQSKQQFCNI